MQHSIVYGNLMQRLHKAQWRSPLGHASPRRGHRPWMANAEPENKPDGSFESLFSKELQRRRLSSMDDDASPGPAESSNTTASPPKGTPPSSPPPGANPFASSSGANSTTRTRSRSAPPPMASEVEGDQRQRSMDMVTEGLEGLPGRAKLLLQLGGSVFLGFLPFMLVFSLLFTGVYSVFGDSFLHGGREMSGPPAYIDPERLLSEPTVDPYIPFDNNPYSSPDLK